MQWLSALIAYFAIWISIISDVIECDAVVKQAVLIVSIVWIYNWYVILVSFYQMVWQLANKILSVFCKSVRLIACHMFVLFCFSRHYC